MDTTKTYELAGVPTAISGNNRYAIKLKEYFCGSEKKISEPASIIINVCNSENEMNFSGEPMFYAEGKGVKINETSFISNIGRLQYRVDNLFIDNKPVCIWLYYNERHNIRRMIKTVMTNLNPYMIGRETEEDRFIVDTLDYSALWWILAIAFLKYNRVFVHSGMASKENRGIVLAGTGGCGKTSAVSELMNEGWKYIAEDFGVICSDCSIWSIPKRGAISAEDVSFGSERLIEVIDQLPKWQKIRWNYYTKKGKNPIIAPPLENLYGFECIATKAKIWKVVCVVRSSNKKIIEKKVSVDEMTTRISGSSFRVIREMYNILYNVQAVVDETCRNNFPLISDIENEYCNIIKKALENTEYSLLEVPINVNPKLIKEYILKGLPD